jgi:formate dehydrogenase subunit gamma
VNTDGRVRFSAPERVFHWAYFVAFVVLAATGAVLYLPWRPLAMGEAGETGRIVHRIFAVILLATPLVAVFSAPRGFLADLWEALKWRRDDVRALRILLTRYYWTGDRTGLPPQGKFTAGQKINIGAQITAFVVMGASGVLLWLGKGVVPVEVLRISVIVHAVAAVVAVCFVIVHVYMVTVLPMTKGAVASMVLGTMEEEYARTHHPRWYPVHTPRRRRERV